MLPTTASRFYHFLLLKQEKKSSPGTNSTFIIQVCVVLEIATFLNMLLTAASSLFKAFSKRRKP